MAWTAPKTYSAGAGLTASEQNTYQRDNTTWLKGAFTTMGQTSDSALCQLKGALYGVRAIRSSNQSITSGSTTSIQFTTADAFDSDTMHDTSTNPERITFPVGGYVLAGWGAKFASDSTGYRKGHIRVDGGTDIEDTIRHSTPGTAAAWSLGGMTLYQVSAGQYFELRVFHNNGSTLNVEEAVMWAAYLFLT